MDDRIPALKQAILENAHHKRRLPARQDATALAADYAAQGFPLQERAVRRFVFLLRSQPAAMLPGQRIVGMRTLPSLPPLYTEAEQAQQPPLGAAALSGPVCNALPDYALLLEEGFLGRKQAILQRQKTGRNTAEQTQFFNGLLECIDAILAYCGSYAIRAEVQGDRALADTLRYAMEHGAGSLREALQILRIAHFALWCAGHQNVPLGRLDHLLLPYYRMDKQRGVTKDEAVSLVSEFYLTLLLDRDLYPAAGNSQAITLGGMDGSGNGAINEMTLIAMLAAADLQLPQLEIRLRTNAQTPASLLEMAARLSQHAPLYIANDDCVIPGLIAAGYAEADARQYAFGAGCTLLVPGALDLPCVGTVQLHALVHNVTAQYLDRCSGIGMLMNLVTNELRQQCDAVFQSARNARLEPAPLFSLLMPACIEKGRDFSLGGIYNAYGIAMDGLAAAADVLNIVRAQVFDSGATSAAAMMQALQAPPQAYTILAQLFPHVPCAGNNDDDADTMLRLVSLALLDCLRNRRNERGGPFLPGAAPAMHTPLPGATHGTLPLISSYTKLDLKKLPRMAPLLLQLPPREAAKAAEVFIRRGGNILQIAVAP